MEEDLDSHYDLCLNGTGLVESILACAASKAGLKVLHLDRNDFYGKDYSSYAYDSWMNLSHIKDQDISHATSTSSSTKRLPAINSNTLVFKNCDETSRFTIITDSSNYSSSTSTETKCISSIYTHPSLYGYDDIHKSDKLSIVPDNSVENLHPSFIGYNTNSIYQSKLHRSALKQSRRFNIDLSSKTLLCSGPALDLLLKSGINSYLEFKSIEGIYYIDNSKPNDLLLVPCSKNDVFSSKLLNAVEKRVLTKFLQFANDYGRESRGECVNTLNEYELNTGRSLHRPQNKTFNSNGYSLADYELKSFNLFMTYCKLPMKLQAIILHALCLHARSISEADVDIFTTRTALIQLSYFLNSLGKYSETALLTPIYGTSEIVQAFCRMSAVWGGIYILRRSISRVNIYDTSTDPHQQKQLLNDDLSSPSSSSVIVEDGELMPTDATNILTTKSLSSSTDTPTNAELSTQDQSILDAVQENENDSSESPQPQYEQLSKRLLLHDSNGNIFSCNSFVSCVEDYAGIFKVDSYLITRVTICDRSILPLSNSLLIIPPNMSTLNNEHSVAVIQLDSSTMVCPDGFYVLHIITQMNLNKIVYYNNSVSSDKNNEQYPLESSWPAYVEEIKSNINTLLAEVMNILQQKYRNSNPDNITSPKEISKDFIEINFMNSIRPLFSFDREAKSVIPCDTQLLPDSITICGETRQDYRISLDDAMTQAQMIFQKLFPDKEFMYEGKPAHGDTNNESNLYNADMDEISYFKSALASQETITTQVNTLDVGTLSNPNNNSCDDDDVIFVKMVDKEKR